jgi:hypothetical protein
MGYLRVRGDNLEENEMKIDTSFDTRSPSMEKYSEEYYVEMDKWERPEPKLWVIAHTEKEFSPEYEDKDYREAIRKLDEEFPGLTNRETINPHKIQRAPNKWNVIKDRLKELK